jgi:prepilin-type processing-associated H-X9-DG protein
MTGHPKNVLLQVLVSLVVALLLALVLLPQLGKARESARRMNCASNLKQIGIAIRTYAEMNQERCPVDLESPTLVGSWRLLMSQMSPLEKVLLCPSDRRGYQPARSLDVLMETNTSYSYVPNMLWQPTKSDSILALDRIYDTAKGSMWPSNGNHLRRPITELDFSGVQGGNVLFSDGHVEFHTTLPSELKDKDGRVRVLSP